MPFLHRKPDKPLSQYVELLWLSENYSVPHKRERLLPEGTVELVINLNEDHIRIYNSDDYEQFRTIPGCVVSGPRSTFFCGGYRYAVCHHWSALQGRRLLTVFRHTDQRD